MLLFLDYLFALLHGLFIAFNLSGWFWNKTRKLHLYTITMTLLSWFGLGYFYGWGYCPPVDWHWQIKRKLGESDLPASYIKYYADKITALSWDPNFIDSLVVALGLLAFIVSWIVNLKRRS